MRGAVDTEIAATRTRILDAAAVVFAESGFAAATIRTICSRAKVNVAAINYHFGSKEELYREVLRYARRRVHEKYPVRYGLAPDASPRDRLYAYVRSFLLRTCTDEMSLCWGTLLMREMVEPTSALDMIVEEGIRSLFGELVEIVGLLLGGDADPELVVSSARSVMSQCLFYLFSRSVISRMSAGTGSEPTDLQKIAEHIVTFSCHAFHGLASGKGAAGND
ncbi:CerR family C-terminal domain-containing protein [Geomonas sp. RF6]|uniref:CerR family C-terminal domain-containing protein n=1 Tax=Geomonas sp. RF6 TaxID=2897342 RepID=UPI001E3D9799|nr:CerR family C-terminal domain-containing protein [Geomonas sp. RF6]UFS70835.1 CerR family C-terminal domain-containing protein [Geomonas sp. RF6]